jgi:hypothetical protein
MIPRGHQGGSRPIPHFNKKTLAKLINPSDSLLAYKEDPTDTEFAKANEGMSFVSP